MGQRSDVGRWRGDCESGLGDASGLQNILDGGCSGLQDVEPDVWLQTFDDGEAQQLRIVDRDAFRHIDDIRGELVDGLGRLLLSRPHVGRLLPSVDVGDGEALTKGCQQRVQRCLGRLRQ